MLLVPSRGDRPDGSGVAPRGVGYGSRPASPSLARSYLSFSVDMIRSSILSGSVQLCRTHQSLSRSLPSTTYIYYHSLPFRRYISAPTGSSSLPRRCEGAISYQITVACCSWNGLACLDFFFSLFRIHVLSSRRSGRNTRHRPILILANSFCGCTMLRRPLSIAISTELTSTTQAPLPL
jgi:hypothetical protein